MSESDPTQAAGNPPSVTQSASNPEEPNFAVHVWLGISLAGGLFGLLLVLTVLGTEGFATAIFGAVLGLGVGFLYAGIVAIPVVLVMAVASWGIRATRWRALLAIAAGATTGTLCPSPIANSDGFLFPFGATELAIALAALLGSLGAWIAAVLWARRMPQITDTGGERVGGAEAPVTNRFLRIGVLGVVIAVFVAVCLGVICLARQEGEAGRRSQCGFNLRQIAMSLQNYEAANGSLPPAYMTDKAGSPVLSWRVTAARYCFYNLDFSKELDSGQPWNSPKNAAFLNGVHAGSLFHCPSSGKKREDPLTDYVAVVGPDTLWPGKVPADLKTHPRGILVVEWPDSDIHWAEPRDVTVEEFLDRFRRKPPRWGFLNWLFAKRPQHGGFHPGCLLYVDAQGKVGELPDDADPETVRELLTGQSSGRP